MKSEVPKLGRSEAYVSRATAENWADFSPFFAVPPSGSAPAEPEDAAAAAAGEPFADDCRLETARGERADGQLVLR